MSGDTLWCSDKVRSLVAARHAGGLVKVGRTARGWRQEDLGGRLGCSTSTISRLEARHCPSDLRLLRRAAEEVGVPTDVLTASLALSGTVTTRVSLDGPQVEEDPMRRRTLLAAAGLAAPAQFLIGVDVALAGVPDPSGSAAPLDQRLARARGLFDAGRHARLLEALPGLLGDAHVAARSRQELALARVSTTYSLLAQVLTKIGRYEQSRQAADRAIVYADLSGSPLAAAAAAREMSIVLRHQDQPAASQRLILKAAAQVEAAGLTNSAQTSAYAQMLCTQAYSAARAGDRAQALATIGEAQRAARLLPEQAPAGRLFPLTPAAVALYAVGVHWALGDAGAALEAGTDLHEDQFPTPERRARMHTDLARAWWQMAKPESAADALLHAVRASRGEVRDRPAIRRIVTDLAQRHPRTAGVRELTAAVTTSR
ncbi:MULTISPECIES: helix-turn-helix transcriptional regulator [Streptomyces]|uniref:Helix-turn-helix transcriptional regulator n=3 Tax=Streptomyces rimosus TaxID=1927 RepID=L8EUN3_STRR1|nr:MULTISPECIES: helix-turn-helix transcriptional regulator [Streptomyces]KOG75030.1 DNA-binding protein [Kitasatospora aureofaciens]MYT45498.1 helix-turn-helix domain-containing protein [Streptomyces sp. SID5471]KUJ40386.1 DNA-binding protein [Streptomyces rimosus subsp. rimosus]QDA02831.1 XRE family transcriptional regulator [Streptomyces rimosus]QEV74102.1 XRE family transcriptional regulator [Streptomyces rimosus]